MTRKSWTNITGIKAALLFLLTSFSIICGQTSGQIDTSRTFRLKIPFEVLSYQLEEENNLNRFSLYMPFLSDTTSLWIRTRMALADLSESDNSILSGQKTLDPLYQKYIQKENLKFLHSVLASIQAGAAGYIAYKHLKKYGFFKKK